MGRGREGEGGTKLGRCVFIARISPLFTLYLRLFAASSVLSPARFISHLRGARSLACRYYLYDTTGYFLLDFFCPRRDLFLPLYDFTFILAITDFGVN